MSLGTLGKGWLDQEKVRPGGTRRHCMIRFARNQISVCIRYLVCASNTAVARKGLAVLNRYANSAGPKKPLKTINF